jgi:hypothetical protein
MDFFQYDLICYYSWNTDLDIHKIIFQYASEKQEDKAALNFHLTQREKNHIMYSPDIKYNLESFDKLIRLFNKNDSIITKPVE